MENMLTLYLVSLICSFITGFDATIGQQHGICLYH